MLPRRILVIYLKRVGDILLTTPAVARLRQLFPQAQIDFLIYPQFANILEDNPHINHLVIYPKSNPWKLPWILRKGQYDWVVDVLSNGASAWACLFSGARHRIAFEGRYPKLIHNVQIPYPTRTLYTTLLRTSLIDGAVKRLCPEFKVDDVQDDFWRPQLYISNDIREKWRHSISQKGYRIGSQPLIMMSPVSRRVTKGWNAEGFARVARMLVDQFNADIECLWGPGEKNDVERVVSLAQSERVHVAPPVEGIKNLGAYLANADCLITNCSGNKHVAVAMRVPTVTIHMSTDPEVWNPPNPEGSGFHPLHPIVRRDDLFCIGCNKTDCPYQLECSTGLSPERVFEATAGLLEYRGFKRQRMGASISA